MAAPTDVVNALYGEFFERGVRHFLPWRRIQALGKPNSNIPAFRLNPRPDGRLQVQWGGLAYAVHCEGKSLSQDELRFRLDTAAVAYFKQMAAELGMTYQNLINLFLRDCAQQKRRPRIQWPEDAPSQPVRR